MDIERIRERLADIAGRRKHVRFDEIANLLDKHIGPIVPNYNHHGSPHHAFTVGTETEVETFTIPEPKGQFVKKVYIDKFLDAMAALGFHDEEEG